MVVDVVLVVIVLSTLVSPVVDTPVETAPSEPTVVEAVVVETGALAGSFRATVPAVATIYAVPCCSSTILVAYAVA